MVPYLVLYWTMLFGFLLPMLDGAFALGTALVAIIALALILVIWFIYQQYLKPLTQKLDELVGAPEHFDNMSRHMRDTSANLLQAEAALARQSRPGPRGASAYRRPV